MLHEKYESIQSIWQLVEDGELLAYSNDSLATVLNLDELTSMTWESPLVLNADQLSQAMVKASYLSNSEIIAFLDANSKNFGIELNTHSIALTYEPVTESGINLGRQPWFFIDVIELKEVLPQHQVDFLNAYVSSQLQRGDLDNIYIRQNNNYLNIGEDLAYKAVFYDHLFAPSYELLDSAIAQSWISMVELMAFAHAAQMKSVYADQNLKKEIPYDQLSQFVKVRVPNPDKPDDPYNQVEIDVAVLYDGSGIKNFRILNTEDQWILESEWVGEEYKLIYLDITEEVEGLPQYCQYWMQLMAVTQSED